MNNENGTLHSDALKFKIKTAISKVCCFALPI